MAAEARPAEVLLPSGMMTLSRSFAWNSLMQIGMLSIKLLKLSRQTSNFLTT